MPEESMEAPEEDISLVSTKYQNGVRVNPEWLERAKQEQLVPDARKSPFTPEFVERVKQAQEQMKQHLNQQQPPPKKPCCDGSLGINPVIFVVGLGLLGFAIGVYYFKYSGAPCGAGGSCTTGI